MTKKQYSLTDQELYTILAALRFYRERDQGAPESRSDEIHAIATKGGEETILDNDDVEKLYEWLATNGKKQDQLQEAAPELLEACEQFVRAIEGYERRTGKLQLHPCVDRARAAIAKATKAALK